MTIIPEGNYKIGRLNMWSYSCNRVIVWLSWNKHFSEVKRYLKVERGMAGSLGLLAICGGEEGELAISVGLLLATFHISLTRMFKCNPDKCLAASAHYNCHEFQVDYSTEGRSTGVMLRFTSDEIMLSMDAWLDQLHGNAETKGFAKFPYCGGVGGVWCWFDWIPRAFTNRKIAGQDET